MTWIDPGNIYNLSARVLLKWAFSIWLKFNPDPLPHFHTPNPQQLFKDNPSFFSVDMKFESKELCGIWSLKVKDILESTGGTPITPP